MSPRKKKKPEIIQATLEEVLEEPKSKHTRKSKPKTVPKKAPKSSKKTEKTSKTSAKKGSKKTAKKKATKPKAKPPPKSDGTGTPLTVLPGIGSKLALKLKEAGYGTVEKLAKGRAQSISKKVDGLSLDKAQKLVQAAKVLLKREAERTAGSAEEDTFERPFALTDVPGVGKKLALKLKAAGYDSVSRLSRARPQSLAKSIDGLSVSKAQELIGAAYEMVQAYQLRSMSEETQRAVAKAPMAKKEPEGKKKPKKTKQSKSKARSTPRVPTEPKPELAATKSATPEPTPEPEVESVSTTKPTKRKRKSKKIIRKKSGLPVPEAVQKAARDMKRKWRQAEKRESAAIAAKIPTATVEVVPLTSDETRERLVEMAMEILNETMMTGRPVFEIPSRSSDNIVWDEVRDLLLLGMRKIARPYHSLASVVDATRTARIMEIVYQLLKSGLHATKREVYYSDVNLFRDQKYSDKIIEDIASMLQTTRDSIHVVASARGSAMGRVIIRDGGDLIDLTKMGTGGWAITPFLDQVEIVESDAEFIILSEKDAAVMRLAEAKYWNRQPCIILTGKGSGDIATRAFLKRLVKELEIPAFALVDSDPYGHYIYSVFLRGSKRLSYESPFIATPELKLLGVLSRDLDEYNIPKAVRIPMEPADIKRVKDMLKEPFVQANKEWVQDLKLMLKMKEKAEIQAFASHSFQFLTDEYLPRKLETGDWI